MSLPIIEDPFKHLAIDIVGALEKTQAENCYILVVCDYTKIYFAIRYQAVVVHDVHTQQWPRNNSPCYCHGDTLSLSDCWFKDVEYRSCGKGHLARACHIKSKLQQLQAEATDREVTDVPLVAGRWLRPPRQFCSFGYFPLLCTVVQMA